ncbi:MAG TPA: ferrous iron transport protein A [Deinococcales bacterium]|nr:ferrous iron transport protein A [Deinococcales bacterium]
MEAALPQPLAVSLSQLGPGECASVLGVERDSPLRRRLMELGFVRGARVQVLRRAPMGDPVEVQVGGTRLALRAIDLGSISIEPDGAGGPATPR